MMAAAKIISINVAAACALSDCRVFFTEKQEQTTALLCPEFFQSTLNVIDGRFVKSPSKLLF